MPLDFPTSYSLVSRREQTNLNEVWASVFKDKKDSNNLGNSASLKTTFNFIHDCNVYYDNIKDLPRKDSHWKAAYERRLKINLRWEKCEFKTTRFKGHDSAVFNVNILNDDKMVTCGDGTPIRVWDLQAKKCVFTAKSEKHGYLALHFNPITQLLYSGSFSGSLKVWDYNGIKRGSIDKLSVKEMKEQLSKNRIDYSDCIDKDQFYQLCKDYNLFPLLEPVQNMEHHSGAILGLATLPFNSFCGISSNSTSNSTPSNNNNSKHGCGSGRFCSASETSGTFLGSRCSKSSCFGKSKSSFLYEDECHVHPSMIFASSGHDGVIRIWNTQNGNLLQQLPGHQGSTNGLAFFKSNPHLISIGHDSLTTITDVETKKKVCNLQGHLGWVWGLHLNLETETEIITSSIDKTVKVWDLNSGKCVKTLQDTAEVPSVWADWNRHRLIYSSFSGNASLVDMRTWKIIKVFDGFTDRCTRIAVGNEDVFVASFDGTVRQFRCHD